MRESRPFLIAAAGCCVLLAAGCKHPNHPVSRDDIKIRVELSRGFVRNNMTRKELDSTNKMVAEQLEDADDLDDVIITLLIVAPIAAGIETAIDSAETTKGYIWPKEHTLYRQRLYWGDNRVYLPRELEGQTVPVIVEFRGTYSGFHEFTVDLSKRRARVKL